MNAPNKSAVHLVVHVELKNSYGQLITDDLTNKQPFTSRDICRIWHKPSIQQSCYFGDR